MADAKIAFLITVDPEHEGGFQDDPHDHANWSSGKIGEGELIGTKYGITPQDMPGVNIKDLTPEQAVDFYTERYWKTLYTDINDQRIANKLADMGVLFGVGSAVKTLQNALQIDQDGQFGFGTLTAVNNQDAETLLQSYKNSLVAHALAVAAKNPEERRYAGGWIKRINS